MRFFMMDYLEFNLRKVLVDNTGFCSKKCHIFDGLMNQDQVASQKQEKQMFSCFEKCLGKFSDSYDNALEVFGDHLRTINTNQVYQHSVKAGQEADKIGQDHRFLLGQGSLDPIYDKPTATKRSPQSLRKSELE
ncbi:hypothetical protein FGO68_gene14673 [Halteria grandinella]|uniref:Uncharacterized protein n=1 Tax=Halteria grandinella TaxID=5974 RepID=A0A8J8NHM8_HALGN|nr:hypothetical protein FGO68_gene14673 [Halteria grandinella]